MIKSVKEKIAGLEVEWTLAPRSKKKEIHKEMLELEKKLKKKPVINISEYWLG